jgi:uncharacterized protein YfaS (alpha-2-macroglobulin family)
LKFKREGIMGLFKNGRTRRGSLYFLAVILLSSFFFCTALPASSYAGFFDWFFPSKKETQKEKAVTPSIQAPKAPEEKMPPPKSFTITGIEPGPQASGVVKITFTETCYADNLKDKLRIFPPVQIDWSNSQFTDKTLLLKGQFKCEQEYTVTIPESVECRGKRYVKTKNTFKMPDLDSGIQLADPDTVIERDSRQMLHAKVTNVEELLFQGFRIPPLVAPQVIKEIKALTEPQKAPGSGVAAKTNAVRPSLPAAVSFEKIRELVEKKYEEINRIPDVQQELANLIDPPSADSQMFFPGKVRNKTQDFSLPLSFRKDKEKGAIELIQLRSNRTTEKAETSVKVYRITDLGIAYKLSKGSLLLWVTSLNSGKPVSDVSLVAVLKDSDILPLGKTDEKGVLYIKGSHLRPRFSLKQNVRLEPSPVPIRDIEFIVAGSPTDSTYIELNEGGNIRPDWVSQITSVKDKTSLSNGRLFTERGIYRPGEKVFFKGVVREYKEGSIKPPSKLKPKVTIVNSKDEEIYSKEIPLSKFGTVYDSLDIKPFFPLGTYTVKMKYSDEQRPVHNEEMRPIGEYSDEEDEGLYEEKPSVIEGTAVTTFEVQEFVAPRHFVELSFKKDKKVDESYVNFKKEIDLLVCNISGVYYAGGPVKHGKVRWKASYRGTDFSIKDYKNYTFGSVIEEPIDIIESGEAMLDEKGKLSVTFPLSKEVASGLYSVEVSATVVDFDGRASTDSATYQEEPDYKVGISSHEASVRSGEMQVFKAIVVDKAGKRLKSGDLRVDVLREDWIYVRKRNDQGAIYWEDKRAYRKDHSSAIKIRNSEAVFDFDFANGGNYLIKITYKAEDGKEYSSGTAYAVEGYYYRYGYKDRNRNFERLAVSAERKEYSPGETIKVLIYPQKPLASVLMTIERRGVLEYRNLGPVNGKKYVDIPVENKHAPNVYISFLGTVARKDFPMYTAQFDDKAPDFLFGVVNVEIKKETGDLKVRINEDDPELKFEPGAEVKLKVLSTDKTGKGIETEVALCVVDESVLALTRFKTPVLEELSRFAVPLSVFTGELRTELLKQTPYGYIRNERLTGGDGGGGGREISLSKLRKDFRPVAYFNPALKTDKDGYAEASFTLPDSMTNYRVYAVSCDKGSRFASFERGLLAVKDFYLEPGTPRFFTRGDTFRFFVSAFNKTKTEGTGRFTLGKDELLSLSSPEESFQMKAMDRTLIAVKGEALLPGTANLLFKGEFSDKKDEVEIKAQVRSGHVLWNDVVFSNVRGSADIAYQFPEYLSGMDWKGLHPEDVKGILTITGSPFIKMSKGLRYLLHYPYGCIEQTSSAVMPLAALRELIKAGLIADITISETDKFLKPGVDRILSMQTSSGGFAYWPGNVNPDMWGTIYALSALTRAQEAGLEVPQERMTSALEYLLKTIKEQSVPDQAFRGYAVYLLAVNNRLEAPVLRDVYKNINTMSREAALMTLLAAKTIKLLPEEELKNRARAVIDRQRENGRTYSFHAYYREPAIALIASTLILKDEAVSGRIARELLGGINREGIWTSTSDTGWSLVALAGYFKGSIFSGKPIKVTLSQAGSTKTTVTLDPTGSYSYALDSAAFMKNPSVSIVSEPGVDLISMLSLTFPRTDLAKKGYSKGFRVHKTIENMDGSKEVRVGDVVRVKIDIEAEGQPYNYVVLDDPLPAGLVAINSAIKTEELLPRAETQGDDSYYWDEWDGESGAYRFTPNHFEMRDDRVLAFKDRVWKGHYQYSYYARAVCEGRFVMPSTKVQLMYEPDVASFTPMEQFVILERGDKDR